MPLLWQHFGMTGTSTISTECVTEKKKNRLFSAENETLTRKTVLQIKLRYVHRGMTTNKKNKYIRGKINGGWKKTTPRGGDGFQGENKLKCIHIPKQKKTCNHVIMGMGINNKKNKKTGYNQAIKYGIR